MIWMGHRFELIENDVRWRKLRVEMVYGYIYIYVEYVKSGISSMKVEIKKEFTHFIKIMSI